MRNYKKTSNHNSQKYAKDKAKSGKKTKPLQLIKGKGQQNSHLSSTFFEGGGLYYIMYGKHPVLAALNNPNRLIKKIYCLKKTFLEHESELRKFEVEITSNEVITKKIGLGQPHQGIIAYVQSVFLKNITEMDFSPTSASSEKTREPVIPHKNKTSPDIIVEKDNIDRVVILDQITDPQNVGAIIRSAAAFGITKIILPADNSPEENASMAKAASGCLEIVQIAKVTNLKSTIDFLKKKGFWIAGLDIRGEDSIDNLHKFNKLGIIIGSEAKGMRRLTVEACDLLVKIPISNKVESLNAANAASIIFHNLKTL